MAEMIPTRPNDYDYKGIKKADCDCLTAAVLLGIKNEDAFKMWHPEYLDSRGRLSDHGSEVAKQFFNVPKHKEYTKAFKATIEDFCKGKGGEDKPTTTISEARKDKALKALLNQAMSLVESGTDLDPDSIKVITDIFNKLGFIKSEQEVEVKPIRVLPTRCLSECRYRLFVEQAVTDCNVLDECAYCKARKYAEENGFKFDSTKLLDIPQKVIDEINKKNNINLLDIINGKVDN